MQCESLPRKFKPNPGMTSITKNQLNFLNILFSNTIMKKTLLSVLALVCGVLMGTAAQGSGSAPLTVDQIIDQGTPASPIAETFVKGYIVGFIADKSIQTDCVFGVPTEEKSNNANILIASSTGEDDYNYCLPVQLPNGAVRSALNLVDHPENLGKMVTLVGTNEKYFGVNGIKSVTNFAWGETIDVEPTPEGPVTTLDEKFASIPANWTNVTLAGDKKFYATSYQSDTYAAMTGYKGTAPFDAWLISPAIDIAKCDKKVLTFDSQVNGYGSTTTQFKAYVLTSKDPATATKTELSCNMATAPATGYSGFVSSGDIDLSSYTGEIYIGFNYTATEDANYATWCVTNVKLNAQGGEPINPGNMGTAQNPLTVSELMANALPEKDKGVPGWYVKGYIVGYVPGMTIKDAVFGVPTDPETQKTNILIAESADCTDVNSCVAVQLPAGDIRTALNLVDNPGNLGKLVTLCGKYEKYFGVAGLKNVVSYAFDGEVPPTPGTHLYYSLENNADGWTVEYNIPLNENLSYVWNWDSSYSNYKASAYKDQAYEADATAISPEIDLTEASNLTLSFTHTGNKFSSLEDAQANVAVMIREVGGAWENVTIPTWFTNTNWTFVDCKDIDINSYAGKKIQIGLNYKSEAGNGGTWEVKKLYIDGKSSGVKGIVAAPFSVRVVNGSIIAPEGAQVYNMSGMRTGSENLQKGIYMVSVEGKTVKVIVK